MGLIDSMMNTRWAWGVAMSAALHATGDVLPAPTERVTRDGVEALVFDAGAVAVRVSLGEDAVREALADVVDVAQVEASIDSWWVVRLAAPASGPAEQREGLVELSALTPVDAVSPVFVDTFGAPLIAPPHVLVRFDAGASVATQLEALEGVGLVVDEADFGGMSNAYRAELVGAPVGFDSLAAANALASRDDVEWADVDWIFSGRSTFTPSDPDFADQWGLSNTGQFTGTPGFDIGAPLAWDVTTGSASVVSLVIDVGVQADHPDLNLAPGADVTSDGPGDGSPVNGCDDHGTPVAGCIAAKRDNGLGGTGVAPDTTVASARTFISNLTCDGTWTTQASWTVDALAHGESVGATISNNSNAYGFNSPAIDAKYADTRANGMVHFGSIGNNDFGFATYPSSLNVVNAIGAIQSDGTKAPFSNFGPDVVVVAPGVTVLTTDRESPEGFAPADDFAFVDGTSFAAPYAAGVAALMRSVDPTLTPAQIEAALVSTATDLGAPGTDNVFGAGLVSAVGALETLVGPYGTWVDEGQALVGTAGRPSLVGVGLLLGDTPLSLTLDDVAPGLLANLVLGFTQVSAPFKGGVLVPAPDVVFGGFPTTASPLVIGGDWPVGLPPGVAVSYQYWLVDSGGPQGFSASNALTSITP